MVDSEEDGICGAWTVAQGDLSVSDTVGGRQTVNVPVVRPPRKTASLF
jgi:hypothetical protein